MPFVSNHPAPPTAVAPIHDFVLDDRFGRRPLAQSRDPVICGLTGKSYSPSVFRFRIDHLARGLCLELGWSPNSGSEWDKTIAHFSVNAIDSLVVFWATLRLGGVQTPANAAFSVSELEYQLKASGAKCLFTSLPQLAIAVEAATRVGIPESRIFLIDLPWYQPGSEATTPAPGKFKTVDELIEIGRAGPEIEPVVWSPEINRDRIAFLCYSSGTSGLPKGVKIAHRNVVANVTQLVSHQAVYRSSMPDSTLTVLGLLPLSHIFGLVVVAHAAVFRGDSIVILPKFTLPSLLSSIQSFRIHTLYVVPPIIVIMTKNKHQLDTFDLSSVRLVFTGAAPLGQETVETLERQWPTWELLQGYGLTETCTVVSSSLPYDRMVGSSGILVPGIKVRLVRSGEQSSSLSPSPSPSSSDEITTYDTAGELWVHSPSVTLGYLDNPSATSDSYTPDGYFKTGDEVVIRKNPITGTDHIFVVDRVKELIKVKGHQVAPAELEAHLLTHGYVVDCAVVPVGDEAAGELPKAFVVKAPQLSSSSSSSSSSQSSKASKPSQLEARSESKTETGLNTATTTTTPPSTIPPHLSDADIKHAIDQHVRDHKAKYKWLAGGIEFVDVIPKSPSGKILRRLLRDRGAKAAKAKL